MAVNWNTQDFSLGKARTPLDLATPVNIYTALRKDKRAQSLADLDLTTAQKKEKEQKELEDIWQRARGNPMMASQIMKQTPGFMSHAFKLDGEIQNQKQKQMEAQQKAQKAQMEQQKFTAAKMDKFAGIYSKLPELDESNTSRIDAYHDFKDKNPKLQLPDWNEQIDATLKARAGVGANKGSEFSLAPIYGKDKKGNIIAFQTSKAGGMERIDVPEGITLTPGLQYQNLGDKVVGIDKSGTPVISFTKGVPTEKTPDYQAEITKAIQEAKGIEKPIDVKTRSKSAISKTVSDMRGFYQELDDLGAIVNIDKSSLDNIGARISSSSLGQSVQKAIGTKAQSLRNSIIAMQPELLGAIRKASDMGAKGMDSEKELQFYLRAATDPSDDIQFNLNALRKLDEAYGLGLGLTGPSGANDALNENDLEGF